MITNATVVVTGEIQYHSAARVKLAGMFVPHKICAEIGVFDGEFSRHILNHNLSKLYMIDCWEHQDENAYQDGCNCAQEILEQKYKSVISRFTDDQRVQIVRAFSYDAATSISDESLDFCYIDANHGVTDVLVDCVTWWRKVKNGGALCGHDFDGQHGNGVKAALREFLRIIHRDHLDYITDELNTDGSRKGFNSWGIVK